MPSNIEIKAKLPNGIDDAEGIAKSLAKDQKMHEHLLQVDTFFDVPNGRLKLRKENERAVLIAYQRSDEQGPKRSDYILSPVSDPESMEEALKRANGIKGKVEKERKVYLVHWEKHPLTARVHLDLVKGLGEFIEFEVIINEEDEVTLGEEMSQELIKSFKIQPSDLLEGAYMDQLLQTL